MRTRPWFRTVAGATLDAIFVPTCASCGRRGRWVCATCADKLLPILKPGCPRCGVLPPRPCDCAFLPPEIERLRSVYSFHGWVRDAIHRLKYDGERARAPMLADQFTHIRDQLSDMDAIVAVPIHQNRMRTRGFNQSELLAQRVSQIYGLPVIRLLERAEDRGSQVGRSSTDRWQAVNGVFRCIDAAAVRGCRIIVLDDVITTGATVSSCAQELIRCGASVVRGLSVARG